MSNSFPQLRRRAAAIRGAVLALAMMAGSLPWLGPIFAADDGREAPSRTDRDMKDTLALRRGRATFRFDTFGDEAFWGDTLRLHQAIEGSKFGGVGPGVSPRTALSVGLTIDSAALPESLINQLHGGSVNLDDPATTLALLKLNAVVRGHWRVQPGRQSQVGRHTVRAVPLDGGPVVSYRGGSSWKYRAEA